MRYTYNMPPSTPRHKPPKTKKSRESKTITDEGNTHRFARNHRQEGNRTKIGNTHESLKTELR